MQDRALKEERREVAPIVITPLCRRVEALEKEKEAVVAQWNAILEEMNQQKTILCSIQQEVEKCQ